MGTLLKKAICLAAMVVVAGAALPWCASQGATAPPATPPATTQPAHPWAALKTYFPAKARVYRRGGFVLVTDAQANAAMAASAVLNETERRFVATMKRGGFDVHKVPSPLVCLLFTDKQPFVRYGEAADGRDMSWSGGYYSARTNRIALYEYTGRAEAQRTGRGQLAGAGGAEMGATAGASERGGWDEDRLSRTVHEAAHLLAFNSGLQKRGVMYPFWVSEGLATAFETNDTSKLFGPGTDNAARRRSLLRAWRSGQLIGLKQFVTVTRLATNDRDRVEAAYGQAWGLFAFLYMNRRADLADYMARMAREPVGWESKTRLRHLFRDSFGPVRDLDRRWRQWLGKQVSAGGR